MDGAALVESVRTEMETELDRLGSDKSLLAATEARLEPDPVLVTVTAVLATARDRSHDWAQEATDERAADALGDAAVTYAEATDAVLAELDGKTDVTRVDAPFLVLAEGDDVERVAACAVGVPLVLDRLLLQVVSFFVNEADEQRADLFRAQREQLDETLDDAAATLDALCDEGDWKRAEQSALAVVRAAYDDYAQRLDAMGFDPKPIC